MNDTDEPNKRMTFDPNAKYASKAARVVTMKDGASISLPQSNESEWQGKLI